jgi:hypothetical protein
MAPPTHLGRYRLIRRIGRGGMGEVYLAQLETAAEVTRLVAVKVLSGAGDGAPGQAALLTEARLTALLSHPNIVQVLDAGLEDGLSWFAMEFVPGLALSELFAIRSAHIPPWVSARIVADACAAVHALHQARDERGRPLDVVHRDVTPHNLLISWDGIVKLADLGLARSALQQNATRTGVVKGKLGYMSPEQASGAPVDRRTDIFALGVILWEALAGQRLFKGTTHSETLASLLRCQVPALVTVAPDVPAPLAEIAARALERQPAERFATALEMQRELEAALSAAGLVVGAPEVGQVLATLAPERLRDHERWLREPAPSTPRPRAARGAGAPPAAMTGGPLAAIARPPRRWRFLAAVVLGAILTAAAYTVMEARPRSLGDPAPLAVAGPPAIGSTATEGLGGTTIFARPRADPTPGALSPSTPGAPPGRPTAIATFEPRPQPAPPRARHHPQPALTRPPAHRDRASSESASSESAPSERAPSERVPPERGAINVSAGPTWATIRIDGRPVGSTPTVISGLAPGTHIIEAQREDRGPTQRRTVTVQPAATIKLEFSFDE